MSFFSACFYDVFKLPVSWFYQSVVDIASVIGPVDLDRLLDKLASTRNHTEQTRVLDTFFLLRLVIHDDWKRKVIYHAQQAFISSHGRLKVDDILKTCIVCRRTLERLFSEYIGISPKYYARILRFVEAYRLQTKANAAHWSEIIYWLMHSPTVRHLSKNFLSRIFTMLPFAECGSFVW